MTNDEIVDKIARYFEENDDAWNELKHCWKFNWYSQDLRNLLRKALDGGDGE